MQKKLRIVLAQLDFRVGDIDFNLQKHILAATQAREKLQANVIVFPELSLSGYPPEDLLCRPAFLEEINKALKEFITTVEGIYCFVGHPSIEPNCKKPFNACSVIYNGETIALYAKQNLPNYGVFDECRYFSQGESTCVVAIEDLPVGLIICEDVWFSKPLQLAKDKGAKLILIPNASPFEINKHEKRCETLGKRAKQINMPILYVNTIGGQDEIIFDGGSLAMNASGELVQFAGFFSETLMPIDIVFDEVVKIVAPQKTAALPILNNTIERIYKSLILALRDYVAKNHFKKVVVGVSGGIDSALTLVLAVDALGPENVHGLTMPSRFTTNISVEDAALLMANLGVASHNFSIESIYNSFLTTLAPVFNSEKQDVTEENIQARCRAILLMAYSNKFGHLVVTTGNRSELAVGYCTLYGDMAGGFAILKDVPKMLVYQLAQYRNQIHAIIPERIITRKPTAELAHNQIDEDSLPPYFILDKILEYYIEDEQSIQDIIAKGFDAALVQKIVNLIRKNEYKRRQSAVGPRINHKAFGKDRRYPITNGFKG